MHSRSELSDAQIDVVEQPADTYLLVTAGPGTGKTYSLIHRLQYLVDEEGMEPDEVLVLSFSRAAVREIRNRLARQESLARHVTVRTFDSFATQLLADQDPDGSWQQHSYDARIADALRVLRADTESADVIADVQHLVIDEVQDLVGVRADYVRTLLENVRGGFTLLGDPAQGIYGFQLQDEQERLRGSADLYEWVRRAFEGMLVERTLTTNFRVRDMSLEPPPEISKALQEVETDYEEVLFELRTHLLDTGIAMGSLADAVPLLSETTVRTAVLCRTNGQALLVSRELHRNGVQHRLQRSAQDRGVPAWVGALFLQFRSGRRATKNDVQSLLQQHQVPFDDAWTLLKRMDSNRRSATLNLVDVRDGLRTGNVPDELTTSPDSRLIVSTIHRAKGLEFDQVVVVGPGQAGDRLVDQAETARVLYVAMTRPRDTLMHITSVEDLARGRLVEMEGRWLERGFGRYPNLRFGIEVRAEDVEKERPAGSDAFADDPFDLQVYLAERVKTGDRLSCIGAGSGARGTPPRYIVQHGDRHIGVTSENFGWGVRRALPGGRTRERWPKSIEDLYIDSVETVAGSEAAGQEYGLGWAGIWLRPRIAGLGRFDWGRRTDR